MEKAIPTAAVAAVGVTTVSNGAYSMLSPRLSVSAGVPAKVATEDSAENSPLLTKILCMLVVLLLFADQSLMAPNLSAIAAEFGFSDEVRSPYIVGSISIWNFPWAHDDLLHLIWLGPRFISCSCLFLPKSIQYTVHSPYQPSPRAVGRRCMG